MSYQSGNINTNLNDNNYFIRNHNLRRELSLLRFSAREISQRRIMNAIVRELNGDFIPFTKPTIEDILERHSIMTIIEDISIDNSHEKECAVCLDSKKLNTFIKLNCEHKFCSECTISSIESDKHLDGPVCPLCREKITNMIKFN
jgi:deoxyxylulose-5-phosphate synthase